MEQSGQSLEQRISETFLSQKVPEFDLALELSLDEEDCVEALVGSPWAEVVDTCLANWLCVAYFNTDVCVYYLPAFAVAVVRDGLDKPSVAFDFVDFAVANLVPGSPLGRMIQETMSKEQKRALWDWIEWVNSKTDTGSAYLSRNAALLDPDVAGMGL